MNLLPIALAAWTAASAFLLAGPGAASAPEDPPGERLDLTDGRLFIPAAYQPASTGVAVMLHLHGASWAAERSFARARQPGVLVSVVLPGLSAVYTAKFRDRAVFPRILEETRKALAARSGGQAPEVRPVVVTSFSAGFGGVRELLRDPEAFRRIDALVMADSIHAGFTGDPALRQVDPAAMDGFLRFAREAAAGRKRLVISHSQIRPEGYASTTETAEYLIRELGGSREEAREAWPGGLALLSRYRKEGLEVLGFAGDTGAEHMKHLHQLGAFLQRLESPRPQ